MKVDCLFLHPTTHVKKPPTPTGTDNLAFVVMPVGTMALADLLDREGYETRIIHTGVEQTRDRNFSIEGLLKKYDASVVGIDLHWYVHSYDALRIAKSVKQSSNAFVVLGGFTASFFAEEVLSRFDSVDAVIRGDAEIPLLELLRHRSSGEFEEVPNLMYRDGDSLKQSRKRYVANELDLNQLNFSNINLLENFDEYLKFSLSVELTYSKLDRLGYPCLGRGCSVNCSYCGGGQNAYRIITGLETPIFLSKEKVIEQLVRFEEMKVSSAYIGFDPDPARRDYHRELFAMIRKEKIDIGSRFEAWSPCDRGFLRDFRRTFNPLYSSIVHSVQSGSESIRKLNMGFYYSNEELFRWLDDAKNELVPVELAFACGLSRETERHFDETIQLAKKIVEEYPMVLDLYCIPRNLEPCSPSFLHPKEHGINPKFKEFIDYYNLFKGMAEGLPGQSILGYETNYLSESRILELIKRFYDALLHHLRERVHREYIRAEKQSQRHPDF